MLLVTIRFSHFNEKARWALDLAGVAYEEEGHLPGFSNRAVKRHNPAGGSSDKASSRYSTPLLVLDDGAALTDSSAIVRWASERMGETLYPVPAVAELEHELHDRLALHTRRVVYGYLFKSPMTLLRLASANVPGPETWALAATLPLVAHQGYRRMVGGDEAFERSLRIVDEEVARWSAHLDGRDYLVGEQFTAADLAFACAMMPVVMPQHSEGFGAHLVPLDTVPAEPAGRIAVYRETLAGKHALRMFAEHRGTRVVPYGGEPER
ncbi:MAG: glutathione S-transferase family protein [Deltaproteobacteria bacterium]|nr:glutathione S-transferase family protein [Deltaproteobacteria bacterium]